MSQSTLRTTRSLVMVVPGVSKMSNLLSGVPKLLATRARAAGINGVSLVNLLANVFVESKFLAQREDHNYQPANARKNLLKMQGKTDQEILSLVKAGPATFFEVAYGGRRGNDQPGDGGKYFGRGLIQITGKPNYVAFDKAFPAYGVLANPDVLVTNLDASIDAAIWFWKTFVMRSGSDRSIRSSGAIVNGGKNGMAERVASAQRFTNLV